MPGNVALITGCSTGIGRALVHELAAAGYRVVATARRTETLAGLPAALTLPLDVEQTESVEAAVNETMRTLGRIDVLVNNAGYGQMGAVEEVSDEQMHKVFEVNVHGAMRMVRAVVPHMRRQGSGQIVNLSSVAGRIAMPTLGVYCATKYAVEALSDALRLELAPFGIRVVVVEPGFIRTEFEKTALKSSEQSFGKPDSVYAALSRGMQAAFAFSGKNAPGPDAVARVIRRAVQSPRPRARYQVPFSAGLMVKLTALTPARLLDWVLARSMGRLSR